MPADADAVVIGAGPNGLVAANLLADAGWRVIVLEANATPGGAVRTAEVTAPGFRNDLFSAFYPLAAGSPVIRDLGLERHGLRWLRAPVVLGHPRLDGPAAVLSTDIDVTAAALDQFAPGDGDAWRELAALWDDIGAHLVAALLHPFPPVRDGVALATHVGPRRGLELARMAMMTVRRLADERFHGAGGGLLLAGAALHADLTPESAMSALFGLVLCMLGQQHGWPVPEGGAQALTDALVTRLTARGGRVQCDARVDRVIVRDRRAVGVRVAGGDTVSAERAVLADVGAPSLYLDLVGPEHLPGRLIDDLRRFQYGAATFKVDWALSAPVPWLDPAVSGAGTIHVADSMEDMSRTTQQLIWGHVPDRPFLLVGQMTTADPSRSPAGTEALWAYTHLPQKVRDDAGADGITGTWDERESDALAARMEDRIERMAPGFKALVLGRHVFTPRSLEVADANLVGGDVQGGTGQLHQQLIFRPTPGLARSETPVKGLYLASASAHPGGGVHGACGANAAKAALAHDRLRRLFTFAR